MHTRSTAQKGQLTRPRIGPARYARGTAERDAAIARVKAAVIVAPVVLETVGAVLLAYGEELRRLGKDVRTFESARRTWLDPALGELAPEACDASRLMLLADAMRAAGRTPNTIRARLAYVRAAFTYAVRARFIGAHPLPTLRGVLPPKRTREGFDPRREILSLEEFARLVCAPTTAFRERVQFLVAGTVGLRVGELVELRWGDLDPHGPPVEDGGAPSTALHITRQWRRKAKAVGIPKGGGPRMVPLRPDVVAELDRWRAAWPRRYNHTPGAEDLVFPADPSDDRRAVVPALVERRQDDRAILVRLHAALKRLGLEPRRQHAFRHSFVSFLVNAGVRKDIAEQFTHPAPAATIDTYAHYSYRTLYQAVLRIPLRLVEPTGQLELFAEDAYR